MVGIEIGYPDAVTERALLENGDRRAGIANLAPAADPGQLQLWVKEAEQVHIAPTVFDYLLALLTATRENGAGLSPRAGLSLVRLCRAHALLMGRSHVLPDDVIAVFPASLAIGSPGEVSRGRAVALEILERVPMP